MFKDFWKNLTLPLIFLVALTVLYLMWVIFDLPQEAELVDMARGYFAQYGLITVFVSAMLEGFLLLGLYYPGSLVMVLSVILAGRDSTLVTKVVGLVMLGQIAAYTANYFLGKYGWYRLLVAFGLRKPLEDAQKKLTEYGGRAIFISYWQSNLAALISTAAGILHFPPKKFFAYSALAIVIWNILWGTLVYVLGEKAVPFVSFRFAFIAVAAWLGLAFVFRKNIPEPEL